ncbi:hypothetical protein [Acinetobacter sp. NS-4]|uniref:hypothetical protein n=1 Tax=Acinetobacter sp. NS-4 TaxID=3127956 RepID=UPI00307E558F
MQSEKYIRKKFSRLRNLIHDPEMYGKVSGQLILGGIASYVFTSEAKTEWESFLIEILNKKELINYVSLKKIDELLKPHLEVFLVNQSINIEELNQNIADLLKYKSRKNHHYFIVSGLIPIGIYRFANIKIGKFEDTCKLEKISFSEKIKNTYKQILEYNTSKGLIRNLKIYDNEINKELKKFEDQIVLEVENFGDQYISKEKSIKDADHFINELIFLRSLCSNLKFQIGLNTALPEKELRPLHLNYENLSLTIPSKEFTFDSLLDFTCKNDPQLNIAIPFRDLSFPLLSSKFDKDDLLDKIRLAIDWYASSYKSNDSRESFLFCAIGMEVLFSKEKDTISKNLSENTAFLIAKKDVKSRKYIFQKMKELYKKRSGIAHGDNANIEETDLTQIRYYLSYSIITIIRKIQKDDFYSFQDFSNFLEEQKFG